MNNKTAQAKFFFIFSLLLRLQNAHSFEVEITHKEAEAYLTNEYSRGINYYGELSTIGSIELNNMYSFRGGIAFGAAQNLTSLNAFAGAAVHPFAKSNIPAVKPLNFSLAYMYNGLPGYDVHGHSIQPVISYKSRRAGASAGPCFRFTSFFGRPALYETVLSFSAYFNFINNEKLLIGISVSNFDDFNAKNTMAFSLNLNSAVRLNGRWSLVNELKIMQSGDDGLASTFYGIAWRAGAQFAW